MDALLRLFGASKKEPEVDGGARALADQVDELVAYIRNLEKQIVSLQKNAVRYAELGVLEQAHKMLAYRHERQEQLARAHDVIFAVQKARDMLKEAAFDRVAALTLRNLATEMGTAADALEPDALEATQLELDEATDRVRDMTKDLARTKAGARFVVDSEVVKAELDALVPLPAAPVPPAREAVPFVAKEAVIA